MCPPIRPPMKTGAAHSKQCMFAMAQADGTRLALIDGRALAEKTVVDSQTLSWLTRRNSSIKSLPRNAIAGFGRPDVEFGWRQQDGCAEHRCVAAADLLGERDEKER